MVSLNIFKTTQMNNIVENGVLNQNWYRSKSTKPQINRKFNSAEMHFGPN